jgi:hypothetical protein
MGGLLMGKPWKSFLSMMKYGCGLDSQPLTHCSRWKTVW